MFPIVNGSREIKGEYVQETLSSIKVQHFMHNFAVANAMLTNICRQALEHFNETKSRTLRPSNDVV